MKVYKIEAFHQWTMKLDISEKVLKTAVDEINMGLFEANLGGNLYKKRIPLGNKGKSGGARTIIASRGSRRNAQIFPDIFEAYCDLML